MISKTFAPFDEVEQQIQRYIESRSRVWINHNNETGAWVYAVQVCGTDFWLDAFDTEDEAKKYIQENMLVLADEN